LDCSACPVHPHNHDYWGDAPYISNAVCDYWGDSYCTQSEYVSTDGDYYSVETGSQCQLNDTITIGYRDKLDECHTMYSHWSYYSDDYYNCHREDSSSQVKPAAISIVLVLFVLFSCCLYWVTRAETQKQRLSRLLPPTTFFSFLVFASSWGAVYAPLGSISGLFGIITGLVAYCSGFGRHSRTHVPAEGSGGNPGPGFRSECAGRSCIAHVYSLYISLAVFATLFGVVTNVIMCSVW
jgi:hypothetical protein